VNAAKVFTKYYYGTVRLLGFKS